MNPSFFVQPLQIATPNALRDAVAASTCNFSIKPLSLSGPAYLEVMDLCFIIYQICLNSFGELANSLILFSKFYDFSFLL